MMTLFQLEKMQIHANVIHASASPKSIEKQSFHRHLNDL